MGTKKKPVKKSKSKSKKHSAAKHVERSPSQEVPESKVVDTEHSDETELEPQSEDDAVLPVDVPEKAGDAPVEDQTVPEDDQIVPEPEVDERSDPKLKYPPVCHQRIEKLKLSECGPGGGRNSVGRKLSLQVASDAAKQEKRRVSFADLKQIKHPLQDTWTFWYYMGDKYKQWNENLRHVCKVSTVEDFWCLYNDLVSPTQLSSGKDFSLFKGHIRPEWEDAANRTGGMWSFCPRDKNSKSSDMDKVWLEMLMFLIGDQFDKLSQYVNGVTYSKRKAQDRISLWIGTDLSKTDEILKIGHAMKGAISYVAQSFKLEYSTSDDWKQKSGSTVTVRHSL